jgi:hypothetical protein
MIICMMHEAFSIERHAWQNLLIHTYLSLRNSHPNIERPNSKGGYRCDIQKFEFIPVVG